MSPHNLQTQNQLEARARLFLDTVQATRARFKRKTRAKARVVFNAYCKIIAKKHASLLPIAPEVIVKEILKVDYIEQESIPSEPLEDFKTSKSLTEIAGLIDRKQTRIVIATKFPPDWRRFTAAHEIGHWVLHKDVVYLRERPAYIREYKPQQRDLFGDVRLRERPITGHELGHSKRPPEEREADTFAADLLMPPELLVRHFFYRFGGPITAERITEDLAFWLSIGQKSFTAREFSNWPRRDRSCHLARMKSFNGRSFHSLSQEFGVSISPIAIQLEDLGLVQ
jgi:Zn-dependent peptidase ImmA (M78 family)